MAGIADFFSNFGRVNDPNGLLSDDQQRDAQMRGILALAAPLLEAGQRSPVRQSIGGALGKGISGMLQAQRGALQDAMQQKLFPLQLRQAQLANQRGEDERARESQQQSALYNMTEPMISAPSGEAAGFQPGDAEAMVPARAGTDPALGQALRASGGKGLEYLLKSRMGADSPANVRTFEYFQKLSPTDQAKFLTTLRGEGTVDIGDRIIPRLAVTNPGLFQQLYGGSAPGGAALPPASASSAASGGRPPGVDIRLAPKDQPATRGAQAAEVESAKSQAQRDEDYNKARTAIGNLERGSALVMDTIDKAMNLAKSSPMATGLGYWLTPKNVPGAPASEMDNFIDTIKANIGFDALQRMREASPTGGALGQVTDFENRLLQAINGTIDPRQKGQLLDNLAIIRNLYPKVLAERRAAFDRDYPQGKARGSLGGEANAPASSAAQPGATKRIKIDANGNIIP